MRLEVLVSTMHQKDHSLLDKMNIQTDAIIINQCDRNEVEEFIFKNNKILWISVNERGVGLSRNTALMRASADIVLFADDDVRYIDNYEEIILSMFKKNPNVGLITFNLKSKNKDRPEYIDNKNHKLNSFNCLRYGAFRFAVRRNSILAKNIYFSLLFGGNAKFQAGEDNLFITQCLQNGVKCMACKKYIGSVEQAQSTWFKGYDLKYYYDRGALFFAMYGKHAKKMLFLITIKNRRRKTNVSVYDQLRYGNKGIKNYFK